MCREDKAQRTGPKMLNEQLIDLWYGNGYHWKLVNIFDQEQDGEVTGALLHRVETINRAFVKRINRQTIIGFGGKGDYSPSTQNQSCALDGCL